jgi:hypothetical protein
VTGGTAPYFFDWSSGSMDSIPTGLAAGSYNLEITDDEGCMRSYDFLVEDPEVFTVNIGPDRDTTVCPGSVLSFDLGDSTGYIYEWGSLDGFYADSSSVEIIDTGLYWVNVWNQFGCFASDTLEVNLTNEGIVPNFLLASEGVVGEDIVAVEISWPIPNGVTWEFQEDSVQLVDTYLNSYTFNYLFPGTYTMTMYSDFGACVSKVEKDIIIYADSTEITNNVTLGTNIKTYGLLPNPNDGNFVVNVCLKNDAAVLLRLYNEDGVLINTKTSAEAEEHDVQYSNPELVPGQYHVVIISGNEWKVLTFIKS